MEPFESSLNLQLVEAAGEGDFFTLEGVLADHNFPQQVLNDALQAAVSCTLSTSENVQCVDALIFAGANLKLKDQMSTTLLMKAAKLGRIELARKLLELGIEIDRRDDSQKTALLYALENDYCENVDVVKLLVEQHATVNAKDREGYCPIHRAAERNYIDSMKVLIDNGAQINCPSNSKDTPLHLAAFRGHKEAAALLISKGANPHLRNQAKLCAVDLAATEIAEVLAAKERKPEKAKKAECKSIEPAFVEEASTKEELQETEEVLPEVALPCIEESEAYLTLRREADDAVRQLAEVKRLLEDEASRRLQTEDTLNDLKSEIAKVKAEAKSEIARLKDSERSQQEALVSARNEIAQLRLQITEQPKTAERGRPSLLRLRSAQPYTYSQIVQSVQDDITEFTSELDAWQKSVKPTYDRLVKLVSSLVTRLWEGASVEVFGSYANNLHLPSSDIDLVIVGVRGDSIQALSELNEALGQLGEALESTKFISTASVPVIKCCLVQRHAKVQVDITVQDTKHSGVACREYVKSVLSKSRHIRPIFLVLKQLFYLVDWHEAFKGGLSSYSLFLMVTSYCQGQVPGRVGEVFFGVLNYYANEFDYFSPIYAYDPLLADAPLLSPVSCT
jgi:ankyrin repeat protein/predicted nucleotidyltransferase